VHAHELDSPSFFNEMEVQIAEMQLGTYFEYFSIVVVREHSPPF